MIRFILEIAAEGFALGLFIAAVAVWGGVLTGAF